MAFRGTTIIPKCTGFASRTMHSHRACYAGIDVIAINVDIFDVADEPAMFDGAFACPEERCALAYEEYGPLLRIPRMRSVDVHVVRTMSEFLWYRCKGCLYEISVGWQIPKSGPRVTYVGAIEPTFPPS
jgi:hypothetical protein